MKKELIFLSLTGSQLALRLVMLTSSNSLRVLLNNSKKETVTKIKTNNKIRNRAMTRDNSNNQIRINNQAVAQNVLQSNKPNPVTKRSIILTQVEAIKVTVR